MGHSPTKNVLRQTEQPPAFKQLTAIQSKRFGAADGSQWTSLDRSQAALQVINDIEQLLAAARRCSTLTTGDCASD